MEEIDELIKVKRLAIVNQVAVEVSQMTAAFST
uniref:Uncharacterized protein n=1 Tax=Arundo donax TaxID=35708 RepID=A0A0A9C4J1_ARUDO